MEQDPIRMKLTRRTPEQRQDDEKRRLAPFLSPADQTFKQEKYSFFLEKCCFDAIFPVQESIK